ncbi:hypothetical protein BJ508DRAFT_359960 [Ascobolus immersus RN42]|uniref:Uncharacterized protein n=1 Tax=Ascobolus immersus RN42 TaxID=1160509 RepID=A0A3N4IEB3_ASCIM|nr:hypothetical protein BJ508DRAFT_359960 [Ascobolus immersus RN42]
MFAQSWTKNLAFSVLLLCYPHATTPLAIAPQTPPPTPPTTPPTTITPRPPNTTYLGYPYFPPPLPCTTSGIWTVSSTRTRCGPINFDNYPDFYPPFASTSTLVDAANNYTYTFTRDWYYSNIYATTTGMCPHYCATTVTEAVACETTRPGGPVPYTTECEQPLTLTTAVCPWCPSREEFDCGRYNTKGPNRGGTNTYTKTVCEGTVEVCEDRLVVVDECMYETIPVPTEEFLWAEGTG